MKNVFITGGSGFIGNAVAHAFSIKGYSVTCLCQRLDSKAQLQAQGFAAVMGDMNDPASWVSEAQKAHIVIHAAHLRPGMRLSDGWLKKSQQLRDTALHALVAALKRSGNCEALIYTSGMIAHGDHGTNIIDEDTTPRNSALGRYHLLGEQIMQQAAGEGLPALSIRPGMVYGPNGTFGKHFLAVAEKGKYQYPGNGDNFIPFVHVNDLAQAYLLAAENPPVGQVVNIVDDNPIQVKQMASRLLQEFDGGKASGVPKWLVGFFAGDALAEMLTGSYRVKNTKAKQLLSWEPKYKTFSEGIRDVVNEYKRLKTA